MSKVICDICGTTYQDTADCCPICGYSRDIAAEFAKEDIFFDSTPDRPVQKRKEIFDFDEVNAPASSREEVDEAYVYDDEEEDEGPQHNTFLVVLLTVLIVVLLVLTGFLYLKYFRPNAVKETEPVPVTTLAPTEAPTTQPETTELKIPCQSLALSSGNAELTHQGQAFMLNVVKIPEDTTDELVIVSADESIAMVDDNYNIVAVAQGETVVTITCGEQQISLPVICRFVDDQGQTEPTATEETVPETVNPAVELKLKKTDIRLQVYYYFTLELDCDLKPEDVQWTSEHPYIATVDEKGVVTAVKDGTTQITAKYGDQEVKCIVRCYW